MKITHFSVWTLWDKLDDWIVAFWRKFTGTSERLVIPAQEGAIRANLPRYSQGNAFSGGDFKSGYLSLTENGLNRQITLCEGVTTVKPFQQTNGKTPDSGGTRVFRVADCGEDSVDFIREKNRYYVKDRNPKGGVRLNGKELPSDKRMELKTHDAIQFAHTTLTFFLPEYQAQDKGGRTS